MEQLLNNPFIVEIISALMLGSPWWPEIGIGLADLLLALWLVYRIQNRRAIETRPAPSPEAVREGEEIYDAARAEIAAEAAPLAETPPALEPVAAPAAPQKIEKEIPKPRAVEPTPIEEFEPVEEPEYEYEYEGEEVTEGVEVVAPPAEPVEEEPMPIEEPPAAVDIFTRLKRGLSRTKEAFIGRIDTLLRGAKLDDDSYEELEEALVTADLGVKTAYKLLEKIQTEAGRNKLKDSKAVRQLLRDEITQILEKVEAPLNVENKKPFVIMVIGVNGVGKTTTIGKLAWRYRKAGKKVMMAAADTFRAAAIEQLTEWARRAGADIVKHEANSDPGAVAFDAVKAAVARNVDVLIVDTAGRLHTRVPLMEELKKVKRVISRELEGAPHEVLLVLDATTGQNAISQTQTFSKELGATGIAITKLDGTAKGGVIVGISDQFTIPIRLIGIGERMDDLVDFETKPFVDALF